MDAENKGFDVTGAIIAGEYLYVPYAVQNGLGFEDIATYYRYRIDAVQNATMRDGMLVLTDDMQREIPLRGDPDTLEKFKSQVIDAQLKDYRA